MAQFLTRLRAFGETPIGIVAQAVFYAVLLAFVVMFFQGHGEFIYEGF